MERLRDILQRIDGRGYKAYKDLRGEYAFDHLRLFVDHVQGDPFAAPSRVALIVDADQAGLPADLWGLRDRRIATEDWLTRRVASELARASGGPGSGKSGQLGIDRPGQEVLERTSCLIDGGGIEVRITVGLPAAGRRVLGRAAWELLGRTLPEVVRRTLLEAAHDVEAMRHHADVVEDQALLRRALPDLGLVAFIADGSILPRRSGIDDRPLENDAIPFGPIPENLARTVALKNGGTITGLGIPDGVTLIVGGGYHGKSTLLDALARGIYDHVPGDGRERIVARRGAVTIRAEDGRRVTEVGIDSFIGTLPSGTDTRRFSTERASGSTSQAAGIMEALEAGADVLLIDEDTSASNFLVRDHRMQLLVPPDGEPIRPLVDRARGLSERGVSTILVLGGSSDWFEVADHVIRMDAYRPVDVLAEVKAIMAEHPSPRTRRAEALITIRDRAPQPQSLDPAGRRGRDRAKARGTRAIQYGETEIDVSLLAQLVDDSQTRAIADALIHLHRTSADRHRTVAELSRALNTLIDTEGLCGFAARATGDRAAIRSLDVMAALNRLRTLSVRQTET